ncbi:THAP domain-containing protein 5-like [Ornithodoros turicata]|uniref:THAP domain-containing protein 5-like n=1 Tax=Ornithodoros turicata TaxID=34597 RepID=UPI003138B2A3
MVICCYLGCANRSTFACKESGITYHCFPRDSSLRLAWAHAIGRPSWVPTKNSVVCSKHFRNDDFDRTSPARVRLRQGAVPVAHSSVHALQHLQVLQASRREPSDSTSGPSFEQEGRLGPHCSAQAQQGSSTVSPHSLIHDQQYLQETEVPHTVSEPGPELCDVHEAMDVFASSTMGTSGGHLDTALSGDSTGFDCENLSAFDDWNEATSPSLLESSTTAETPKSLKYPSLITSSSSITFSTPSTSRYTPSHSGGLPVICMPDFVPPVVATTTQRCSTPVL